MGKILILVGFAIALTACGTSKKMNRIMKDEASNQKVLFGECTREAFEKRQFKEWFEPEYMTYNPNDKVLDGLQASKLNETKITIILASWCPDTRRELPRFFKIIDQTNFNLSNLTMIAVNKAKMSDKSVEVKFERVPTFVFERNGVEIGRITEKPIKNLEQDILDILK